MAAMTSSDQFVSDDRAWRAVVQRDKRFDAKLRKSVDVLIQAAGVGARADDEHPRLAVVLGHLGEGLPFYIWRIDNRNMWMKAPHKYAAKKWVGDYFRANFYVTTSGHYSTPALLDTIAELGADRVMFSVDYPFEDFSDAAEWFDQAALSEVDRAKIGRDNARRLFKL